jgi:hypothetical protein
MDRELGVDQERDEGRFGDTVDRGTVGVERAAEGGVTISRVG